MEQYQLGSAENCGTHTFSDLEHVEVNKFKTQEQFKSDQTINSRYAEKLFWSIEALRAEDDESREECLEKVVAPRTIELYFFLQAFLQAIPQILLQLHILMRNVNDLEGQTSKFSCITI